MKQTKKQKAALRERMARWRAESAWRRKMVNNEAQRRHRAKKRGVVFEPEGDPTQKGGRGVEVDLGLL